MGEITCSESIIARASLGRRSNDSADLITRDNKENSRERVHEEDRLAKPHCNVYEGAREAYSEKLPYTLPVSHVYYRNIAEEGD